MADIEVVVNLRGRLIDTCSDFWDVVAEPCGLPEWFAHNLDAWSDTIHGRGISDVVDSHDVLVVHVDQRGLFSEGKRAGQDLTRIFDEEQNVLVVHATR
ncbi:barstar family protein [Streptomyces sp. NPDC003006]